MRLTDLDFTPTEPEPREAGRRACGVAGKGRGPLAASPESA